MHEHFVLIYKTFLNGVDTRNYRRNLCSKNSGIQKSAQKTCERKQRLILRESVLVREAEVSFDRKKLRHAFRVIERLSSVPASGVSTILKVEGAVVMGHERLSGTIYRILSGALK